MENLWPLWTWCCELEETDFAHHQPLLPNACPVGAVILAAETPYLCFAPCRCVYIPCTEEYACQRIDFLWLDCWVLNCPAALQVIPLLTPSWFSSLGSLKVSREKHPWTKCPESSCKRSIQVYRSVQVVWALTLVLKLVTGTDLLSERSRLTVLPWASSLAPMGWSIPTGSVPGTGKCLCCGVLVEQELSSSCWSGTGGEGPASTP